MPDKSPVPFVQTLEQVSEYGQGRLPVKLHQQIPPALGDPHRLPMGRQPCATTVSTVILP